MPATRNAMAYCAATQRRPGRTPRRHRRREGRSRMAATLSASVASRRLQTRALALAPHPPAALSPHQIASGTDGVGHRRRDHKGPPALPLTASPSQHLQCLKVRPPQRAHVRPRCAAGVHAGPRWGCPGGRGPAAPCAQQGAQRPARRRGCHSPTRAATAAWPAALATGPLPPLPVLQVAPESPPPPLDPAWPAAAAQPQAPSAAPTAGRPALT